MSQNNMDRAQRCPNQPYQKNDHGPAVIQVGARMYCRECAAEMLFFVAFDLERRRDALLETAKVVNERIKSMTERLLEPA